MHMIDLAGSAEPQQVASLFQNLAEVGEVSGDFRVIRVDGIARNWTVNATTLPDNHLLGFATDITERLQVEAALSESEERFRLFAELAPVAMVISDREQKTLYTSPRFVKLFGYDMEDIPTITEWWPLAYPDPILREQVRQRWNTLLDGARRDGTEPPIMEHPVTCKDGTVRQIEFRVSTTGELNFVVFTDITERKHAAEALQHRIRMERLAV